MGSMAWPGDSFGELITSEYESIIAGPDKIHYQKYFARPGAIAGEAEKDLRGWLNGLYYGTSAAGGLPPYGTFKNQDEALAFLRETAITDARDSREHVGTRPGWTPGTRCAHVVTDDHGGLVAELPDDVDEGRDLNSNPHLYHGRLGRTAAAEHVNRS